VPFVRSFCSATSRVAITAALVALPAGIGWAAIVGTPAQVAIPPRSAATVDDAKAEYRRPDSIPFPKENPFTAEKLLLGKKLYFDTRLSAAGAQSCASCHNPGYGWGDGLAKGVGDGMKGLKRRSPTVLNAAWGSIFMWDGRAPSLEEQALGPIQSSAEMNMKLDDVVARLTTIPEYKSLFASAFPGEGITSSGIGRAIATYERTVVSGWAPFDAWIDGDESAISASAQRGFGLFAGKAGCSNCHAGWNFTEDSFHDIGLPDADTGRGEFNKVALKMKHAFKTPGLRDIARRGPFMHDGSMPTLAAVVEHYDTGGVARPSRSDLMKPLALTAQEKSDLVAFLETLTGDAGSVPAPLLPR
jgi:cytochrome c peroxidase